MSEWHKNWQLLFPKECREKMLKRGNVKHIADVLINNYVIEFQHTKIELDEFLDRNKFYTSFGYKLIWIFDYINGENIKNIELLCNYFVDESEGIFLYEEKRNNMLMSVDETHTISKNDFIIEIKDGLFPKNKQNFNKQIYFNNINRRRKQNIINKENLSPVYFHPPKKVLVFDSPIKHETRNIPDDYDYVVTNGSDKLEDIIEFNRGKNYWLICKNTRLMYYFENTINDESIKVWAKIGTGADDLDEVHDWQSLKAFKSYRWMPKR